MECPWVQKGCNEDLTLKLCSWGEKGEEGRGLRSSSSLGVMSGAQWSPSLGRSSSLPPEGERTVGERQRSVNVKTPTPPIHELKEPSSKLEGPANSAKGVGSNIQTTIKQENGSMVSQKTMAKKVPPRPADTKPENPAKKHRLENYCSLKGDVMEILRQMPSVTTTGDGPNGKRIEGFLYKYRSGQICIVCVCHGSFFSPAEFVMHAGGKEVTNPMKHITVHCNSF